VPYALGQAARVRQGSAAIAGNHLVMRLQHGNAYVALVHLRAHSFQVAVGDDVITGQPLAECGSSGNSTQPHLHLQVMDGPDPVTAHGVPMAFRDFREWPRGTRQAQVKATGLPGERSVVEPLHGPVSASGSAPGASRR
jgi:murein DD-endopeptidase MepM/ murein hydrolase activator NlpD